MKTSQKHLKNVKNFLKTLIKHKKHRKITQKTLKTPVKILQKNRQKIRKNLPKPLKKRTKSDCSKVSKALKGNFMMNFDLFFG
jgi:hypothetical protein